MLIEPLRRASVGKRSSRKVCRALPDGQIQPLDERRVQCRGVLGVIERVFESPRGSVQRSPFDLDDTIVPARFEDLAVETRWPEEATDDFLVEFESIRDDQREDVRNLSLISTGSGTDPERTYGAASEALPQETGEKQIGHAYGYRVSPRPYRLRGQAVFVGAVASTSQWYDARTGR